MLTPLGRHERTEIQGLPTLLQGTQGFLGDIDEVADHAIPARRVGTEQVGEFHRAP